MRSDSNTEYFKLIVFLLLLFVGIVKTISVYPDGVYNNIAIGLLLAVIVVCVSVCVWLVVLNVACCWTISVYPDGCSNKCVASCC